MAPISYINMQNIKDDTKPNALPITPKIIAIKYFKITPSVSLILAKNHIMADITLVANIIIKFIAIVFEDAMVIEVWQPI